VSDRETRSGRAPLYSLAVNADMVYRHLPYAERVRRIHERGFEVETWMPWTQNLPALLALGIPIASMQGYIHGGLATPEEGDQLVATAAEVIPIARSLGCSDLVFHGGELADGVAVRPLDAVTGAMWLCARKTLDRLAALGEREGVTFCLENLNRRVDHPGVPFAATADTLALVSAVDRPGLRLMLDLYHAQEDEGHLIETVREAGRFIGAVQVADVPGRCEPGTGEIRFEAVAEALADMGYDGRVGMEGYASADDDVALDRFRAALGGPLATAAPASSASPEEAAR
jgi:hydroxypyruvate isomerase